MEGGLSKYSNIMDSIDQKTLAQLGGQPNSVGPLVERHPKLKDHARYKKIVNLVDENAHQGLEVHVHEDIIQEIVDLIEEIGEYVGGGKSKSSADVEAKMKALEKKQKWEDLDSSIVYIEEDGKTTYEYQKRAGGTPKKSSTTTAEPKVQEIELGKFHTEPKSSILTRAQKKRLDPQTPLSETTTQTTSTTSTTTTTNTHQSRADSEEDNMYQLPLTTSTTTTTNTHQSGDGSEEDNTELLQKLPHPPPTSTTEPYDDEPGRSPDPSQYTIIPSSQLTSTKSTSESSQSDNEDEKEHQSKDNITHQPQMNDKEDERVDHDDMKATTTDRGDLTHLNTMIIDQEPLGDWDDENSHQPQTPKQSTNQDESAKEESKESNITNTADAPKDERKNVEPPAPAPMDDQTGKATSTGKGKKNKASTQDSTVESPDPKPVKSKKEANREKKDAKKKSEDLTDGEKPQPPRRPGRPPKEKTSPNQEPSAPVQQEENVGHHYEGPFAKTSRKRFYKAFEIVKDGKNIKWKGVTMQRGAGRTTELTPEYLVKLGDEWYMKRTICQAEAFSIGRGEAGPKQATIVGNTRYLYTKDNKTIRPNAKVIKEALDAQKIDQMTQKGIESLLLQKELSTYKIPKKQKGDRDAEMKDKRYQKLTTQLIHLITRAKGHDENITMKTIGSRIAGKTGPGPAIRAQEQRMQREISEFLKTPQVKNKITLEPLCQAIVSAVESLMLQNHCHAMYTAPLYKAREMMLKVSRNELEQFRKSKEKHSFKFCKWLKNDMTRSRFEKGLETYTKKNLKSVVGVNVKGTFGAEKSQNKSENVTSPRGEKKPNSSSGPKRNQSNDRKARKSTKQ